MSLTVRRSPWILPPPPPPGAGPEPEGPLARLAFSAAWRGRAFAASLARALGRLPGGEPQRDLLARIEQSLAVAERFAALAEEVGAGDVEISVQSRLTAEPLPDASSWAEVAMADVLFGGAADLALSELSRSSDERVARAAGGGAAGFGEPVLAGMASDAKNRPCLEILLDRWAPHAVRVLGRPGSPDELPLLETRIKPRPSSETLAEFLQRTEDTLGALRLRLPDAGRMGVIAPSGWTPRRLDARGRRSRGSSRRPPRS